MVSRYASRLRWICAIALVVLPSVVVRAQQTSLASWPDGTTPSISKTFDPVRIAPGGVTLVTLTLSNPNSTAATLTGELDDTLPSPMVIGGGAAATTCPNGHVSAISGFALFALGVGAQIPAQGSCTVSVCVTTDMAGVFTNTIPAGSLLTDQGSNADPASADLAATDDVIFVDGFDGAPGGCSGFF